MRTFHGSATEHASPDSCCDMFLYPRAIYRDPFREEHHILVMCDTFDEKMKPTATNHRKSCQETTDKCQEEEPWFGIEQELMFLDKETLHPLGWPQCGFPKPQGSYQNSVGFDHVVARELMEALARCCLYAGVPYAGTNVEIAPAQWEYQIGPCLGVSAGDDLWISRFILHRLAEMYGVVVTLDPKPFVGWNGSGAHTNYSTRAMRGENGITEIENAIKKLKAVHMKHIKVYDPHGGLDNERRLIGTQETGSFHVFSAGVADRLASIRIPRLVADSKKGYMEDRRPASNCDPYSVVDAIMRTCILNE